MLGETPSQEWAVSSGFGGMKRLGSVSIIPPDWILSGDTVSVLPESLGERSASPLVGSDSSLSILCAATTSGDVSIIPGAIAVAVDCGSFSDCGTGLFERSSLPHSLILCTP